jgi:hypothetical protein
LKASSEITSVLHSCEAMCVWIYSSFDAAQKVTYRKSHDNNSNNNNNQTNMKSKENKSHFTWQSVFSSRRDWLKASYHWYSFLAFPFFVHIPIATSLLSHTHTHCVTHEREIAIDIWLLDTLTHIFIDRHVLCLSFPFPSRLRISLSRKALTMERNEHILM